MFVDSDDCVHQQMVEIYMFYAEGTGTLICDHTENLEEIKTASWSGVEGRLEQVRYDAFMQLFYRDYVNPPFNKFYDAGIVKGQTIRFLEDRSLGEDLLFNLEYFRHVAGDFRLIHYPLYYYRSDRTGSLSTSYRNDLFELQLELFGQLKRFMEEMDIWNEKNAEIYYCMYWDRLYMTIRMCKAYEKKHSNEKRLSELLAHPVWHEVWSECKKRGLATWKRRIKAGNLKLWTRY